MIQLCANAREQGSTRRAALLNSIRAQAQGSAMIDSVEAPFTKDCFGPFGFQAPGDTEIRATKTLTIFDTLRSVILAGSVFGRIHTRPNPNARTSTQTSLKHRQ